MKKKQSRNRKTMAELADRLEPAGRRTIVFSVPGDRRDEDVRESVRACLPQFNHFVCKADNNRRGRGEDEIPQLVRKFLLEEGVDDANITVIADEEPAVDFALKDAQKGDLLVITADDLTRTWKQIVHFDEDSEDSEARSKDTIPGTKVFVPEKAKRYVLDRDEELIIDERGVRLASHTKEDSD